MTDGREIRSICVTDGRGMGVVTLPTEVEWQC